MARRIIALTLACLCAMLAGGCFCFSNEGVSISDKLTSYYDDTPVAAARFFTRNAEGGYEIEELDKARLPELIEKLDSMSLSRHSFHTDYFWGGQYGIELEYGDGAFMTYDGTKAGYYNASVNDPDAQQQRSTFLEVTNADFWGVMEEFFSSVEKERLSAW